MRSTARTAIITAGIAAAVLIALIVIAAATGSLVVGILALILGLALCAGVTFVALRAMGRLTAASDRASTRARGLEARTGRLEMQAAASADELEDVQGELDRARTQLAAAQDDLLRVGTALRESTGRWEEMRIETRNLRGALARTDAETRATTGDLAGHVRVLRTVREDVTALQEVRASHAEHLTRMSKDLQVLRRRVPADFLDGLRADVDDLRDTSRHTLRASFESSLQLGRDPREVISADHARRLFADYLERDELLQLRPLIENFDLLGEQTLTTLRRLYRSYRRAGYWDLAALAVEQVSATTGREGDARAVDKIRHEIEVFERPALVQPELTGPNAHDPAGPIVHVVGRVLPDTQTGYTLRTQYTAEAQARKGLPVAIVGQSGITGEAVEEVRHYVHHGIDYYLLPGGPRVQLLVDDWLRENIEQLALLVQELRPSVLHAQSDFFNALIAHAVGSQLGIPTIYESRGFWEESWLSRTITSHGWTDPETTFAMYGRPAAYDLRQHAEEVARLLPDHVFTLAEVMRDHILESAHGSIAPEGVSIVTNAVDPAGFPVQAPDQDLKARIGLPPGAVVVGYISSIVEYEGIDTLLDAYHLASAVSDVPMCLLLVGDGDYLPVLKEHAATMGIQDVFFTGRVPHEEVLRYYGLIDLFVVPRKPAAVADLVTPLKPFEAFSTGRAVILSDVGALQEIARQSQAVETFVAGSSDDLSRKLLALVEDPARRADLSARAAAWVRNHRTWDSNVSEYYRVYRKLGYTGPASEVLEAELRLQHRQVNAGDLIAGVRELSDPPLLGWFSVSTIRQSAQDILGRGWTYEEFEPIRLDENVDWASYGERNRSWGFHLHAWEHLDPFLHEHTATGDRAWLEAALRVALDWSDTYLGADAPEDPMAWYDMSLALRTPRLLTLLIRVSTQEDLQAQAVILVDAMLRHVEELQHDEAFNANNNHGFYTAASQLHLARFGAPIPGSQRTGEMGRERMRIMADRQFAADGVHLEHSPDYHRMLLSSFERAVQDGLIDDEEIRDRIRRAAHVLGWMIQPDGHLVQLGDSPSTPMTDTGTTSIDPTTQFILSDGREGEAPTEELAVFHDGGYAFVRSPAPQGPGELGGSGYLAFSAAFHSRAHKHADDLNVVWYDRGTEILVDSGRYGYGDLLPADSPLRKQGFYYGSPERQYVEGTRAHNTLMMDGADQERRSRAPFGSGILDATQDGGVFDLSGRVHHADYIHRRRVVFTPGRELRILDAVFSQAPETREAVIWFNVAGDFELVQTEEILVLERPSEKGPLRLEITGPGRLLEPVRGATDPLSGWRSRQDRSLEPVWSIGFVVPVETRAAVSTVLRLA